MLLYLMEPIGLVVEMSVSGYRDLTVQTPAHQYIVCLSKTLSPHCVSRLSCEMSTMWKHPCEGCLCSAVSSLDE